MSDVTRILSQIERGEAGATDDLLPLVYGELRRLAGLRMAQEKPGQTIQATALVHEAYLRLVGDGTPQTWDSRGHFFAAAAEAMRRILVDRARKRKAAKRGGDQLNRVFLEEEMAVLDDASSEQLLSLDVALQRLAERDATKAELVNLRYFAGLTNAQAAAALGIGVSTADKYWAYSKAWLKAEMRRLAD